MKKTILPLIVLVLAVSMCVSPPEDPTGNVVHGTFMIGETMDLPNYMCEDHDLRGKVVVIHQTGCWACEKVVPILEEIEQENNMTFEYVNLNVDPTRIYELNIQPFYVPTVIIDCTAYVSRNSVWDKEKYETIIKGRVSAQ